MGSTNWLIRCLIGGEQLDENFRIALYPSMEGAIVVGERRCINPAIERKNSLPEKFWFGGWPDDPQLA